MNQPQKKTDPATSRRSAPTSPRSADQTRSNFSTTGPAPAGAESPARSGTGGQLPAPGPALRIVGGLVRPANWTPAAALTGLIADPAGAISGRSPADLFRHGLTIHDALRVDRQRTKIFLLAELGRLWRAVKVGDAKTWEGQDALQDLVDDIVEIFPSMKMEEVIKVLQMIRRGEVKIFGRLDTPTVLEAIRNYEQTHTITLRENYRPHLEMGTVETAALDTTPARAGQMTISEAFKRIAREMPTPTKTLEEIGRATIADLRVIADAKTRTDG